MGKKFQNQKDGRHLIKDYILKERWCHSEERLVSQENLKNRHQSQVSAVPTQTVFREEGVGQIILITESCWPPPVRGELRQLWVLPSLHIGITYQCEAMSLAYKEETSMTSDQKKPLI